MLNKRGFEMSFTWIFALIVGAVILFLAIYASSQIIETGQTKVNAEVGKEIGILLNPLETGLETATMNSFTVPVETRIYNDCNTRGNFGRQLIEVSQKNFGRWEKTDIQVGFSNKYIFSSPEIEGKVFYLFSKPFEFPFKTASLMYMIPKNKKYCFSGDIPEEIKKEIDDLEDSSNRHITTNCTKSETNNLNNIKVCFTPSNTRSCDIKIDYDNNWLINNGETSYFQTDALMYAGIFAEKEEYECQLKRLMMRVASLSEIYLEKSKIVSRADCNTNTESDLKLLKNSATQLLEEGNSENLAQMIFTIEEMEDKNKFANCKLW